MENGENVHVAMQTRSKGLKFVVVSFGQELDWTIPSFPVLTINFHNLGLELTGKKCNGLINRKDFAKIQDKDIPLEGICGSHCHISISDIDYIVLWQWEIFQELRNDIGSDSENSSIVSHISETDLSDTSIGDVNFNANSSGDNSDDKSEHMANHTVPFKVMGVRHNNQNQTHLMKAEARLYTENEHVTAHLVPEPQNEKDSSAISVQINYGDGQHHVGYIPKELTQYIHPLLQANAITNVEIGHIKFCLKWYRIGFYMKLMITRRGRWDPFVVSKAMRAS